MEIISSKSIKSLTLSGNILTYHVNLDKKEKE